MKSSVILSLFISIVFALLSVFTYEKHSTVENTIFFYIFSYGAIFSFALTWPKWRILTFFQNVIAMPFMIMLLLAPLVKSFYLIFVTILFVFGFIVLVLTYLPEALIDFNLNYITKAYLVFTLGSIALVLYGEKIIQMLNNIIDNNKSKEIILAQEQLTLTILNQKKIKYIIFCAFFIVLLCFSILTLNNYQWFKMEGVNQAIFQAFATYIAFDRLHSNKAYFNTNLKDFLSRNLKLIDLSVTSINKNDESKLDIS